ncbi:MAG: hypothetical protein QE263_05045 [Vampirovibrionales bacterium]|nr:hypothetical protein [Vampirovibrionales bacterium]
MSDDKIQFENFTKVLDIGNAEILKLMESAPEYLYEEEEKYSDWMKYSSQVDKLGIIAGVGLIIPPHVNNFLCNHYSWPYSFTENYLLQMILWGIISIGLTRPILWQTIRTLSDGISQIIAEKFTK